MKIYARIVAGFFLFLMTSFCVSGNDMLKIEFSNLARVLMWEETSAGFSSGGVKLCSGREKIGSGERWMDILVKLDTSKASLENTSLMVKTVDKNSGKVLTGAKKSAETPDALVRLNMRSFESGDAELRVEWRDRENNLLGMGVMLVSAEPVQKLSPGTRIPVKIDIPEGAENLENYPVRFGVPLPRGAVWGLEGLKVVDLQGRELPSQLEAAGRWAEEGSVKWMWIDTLVSGKNNIYLEAGERTGASSPATPVSVEAAGEVFTVRTGAAQFVVGKDGSLVKEVRYRGKTAAKEGTSRGLYLIDQKGRLAVASGKDADIRVESPGPVSAVIRIEGFYRTPEGEELARHITRLHFFAGRAGVEAVHTLVITRDTNEVWFKDIGWEFDISPGAAPSALFGLYPANTRDPSKGKIVMAGYTRAIAAREPLPVPASPEKSFSVPLSGKSTLSMLQKDGTSLGLRPPRQIYIHGENSFEIKDSGKGSPLYNGEMMGDWAAVAGKDAGWMVSCRDAAAQHPKEFEVSAGRFNMKLFSSSGGKELDFRMESLMKNWGMLPKEKIASHYEKNPEALNEYLDFIIKHTNNATGWSKTHDLLLAPFEPASNPGMLSLLHSREVFGHVDPKWIRETKVLGPMHPMDTERFPQEEILIRNMFWGMVKQGAGCEAGGFIDYNVGPTWIIHNLKSGSYTIRSDSWYLYARSADRDLRKFAQGANRVFMDANISHWNGKGKTLGLLVGTPSGPGKQSNRSRKADLPLYWEGESDNNYELTTVFNFDQALIDYYMTGYRRSGDIMENFARAVEENLTVKTKHWRVILAVRHIAQAYEFSWKPRLKELIYELTDRYIYDPESPVLLSKARPHRSSTYKMETDGDVFVELYELLGDRLFHRMAKTIATFEWENKGLVIMNGISNRSTGLLGHFLWEETGNLWIAAEFDHSRRRLVGLRLVDEKEGRVMLPCVSTVPGCFKGLSFAMDVLTRMQEEKRETSSWITFIADETPVHLFFNKPGETVNPGHNAPLREGETSMNVLIRNMSAEISGGRKENGVLKPWTSGSSVILKPHTVLRYIFMGHDLHRITEEQRGSSGVVKVNIPKDAPGGVYELELNKKGEYTVLTDKHEPLSLFAPGGWTCPPMNPPVRVYFNVPEKTENGRIFFEKETRLFTPEGEPYQNGEAVFGWVEKLQEKPGLWSFESIDPGKIKTENLPGFFSMGTPDFYMESK
ncbi:MAG TPA: hypothetical protein PKN36_03850 [bacterium]|nr:hypothetical protein [bacterium]